MFTGIYEHTIDKKGRTSMPARFRAELGGQAYLSVGIDKNLVIYSTAHFKAMADEISKLSLADPTARVYRRRMFNKAEFIEIDASGLSTEGEAVPKREDDVTSVTYVTVEEE